MLVFRSFMEIVNNRLDSVWNGSSEAVYAALLVDGGTGLDKNWQTMSEVINSGGWSRATGSSDVVISASKRNIRVQSSPTTTFGAHTIVTTIYDQIDFGVVADSQSLAAVVVYWDSTNGVNRQDSTNQLLWWDDGSVNSAVTSTGTNKWGAAGVTNDCVGIQALTSTPGTYVMLSGMQQLYDSAGMWDSGADTFKLRLYQFPPGAAINNPSDVSTISQIESGAFNYSRVQANAGGDIGDISLSSAVRSVSYNSSQGQWEYKINPGGTSLSFGLAAAGQTVDAVALFNDSTGDIVWFWDSAFTPRTLTAPTTITYGQATEFTAFAYRLL